MPDNPPFPVIVEPNAEMTTRDGTSLRSDIYRPECGGKFPALLCRTPYDKTTARFAATASELASRGYVAVVQDQRGRYASDGEYRWMFRDRTENFDVDDGYDACEWAADRPS